MYASRVSKKVRFFTEFFISAWTYKICFVSKLKVRHLDSFILFSSRWNNGFNRWCEMQINSFSILLVRSAISWRKRRRKELKPPTHPCNYFYRKHSPNAYQTFKRPYPCEVLLKKIKMAAKITWWIHHILRNLVKVHYSKKKACTTVYTVYIIIWYHVDVFVRKRKL